MYSRWSINNASRCRHDDGVLWQVCHVLLTSYIYSLLWAKWVGFSFHHASTRRRVVCTVTAESVGMFGVWRVTELLTQGHTDRPLCRWAALGRFLTAAFCSSDRIIEEEVRMPSAEGARVEALRGEVWGVSVHLPNGGYGEGLFILGAIFRGEIRLCLLPVQPLPRKCFDFRAQNGELWCILGAIFRGEIGRC